MSGLAPSTAAFATARLILRPPRLSDARALYGFRGDPAAMAYTQHFASLAECRRHLVAQERMRRRNGCAPWSILRGNRLIGYGGLYADLFDPGWGVEIAYYFAPAAWGQGYATEFVAHCLREAQRIGLAEVRAFAHPRNAVSRRVLEKAGFEVERIVPAMDRLLFRKRLGRTL